jgi:predicted O-linked N-acetylglucosamine transferase (SPINDLY family)
MKQGELRSAAPTPVELNYLVALYNAGRYAELENLTRKLIEQYPGSGFAWKALGASLRMQGKSALPALQKAADLLPDDADCHNDLGATLQELGQFEGALTSYQRALELKPDLAEAHNNMGNALRNLGQLDRAAVSYRRALEIRPDYADAHNNLGNVLQDLGQLGDALASYRRALEINPDYAEAHSNLGNALKDLGQFDGAVASYRRALVIKPDFAEVQSNLLLCLNYTNSHTPAYQLEQARQYGQILAKKVSRRFSAWQIAIPPERLRVGMVSGDLRQHSVGHFIEGLLPQIDQARIELIAYPTHPKVDDLTARIRPYFSAWKPLFGLSDETSARLIHADGVHVLIDLSGHTAYNRLSVFAWKPAPVQVTWLGYFATTGVAEMDYVLADEVGVPMSHQAHFTESVWYLPDTRLCFTPPASDLSVSPLPSLQNGFITFGCFQNLAKVGDDVLEVWGQIFDALPDARLRIQAKQLGEADQLQKLLMRLQHHGIGRERVTTHASNHREAYLASHAEVDIILDTFPYTGGTTTCEALWMGVPTLTLSGDSLLARQGASLLTAAGLAQWVAESRKDYVTRAIALASDRPGLAGLRAGLRRQVQASPLFDSHRFARNFEDALWGMWQARAKTQFQC